MKSFKLKLAFICLAAFPALAGDIVRPKLATKFNRGYREWAGVGHEKYNGTWFAGTWNVSWRLSKLPYYPVVWGNQERQSDPLCVICVNGGKGGQLQLSEGAETEKATEDDGFDDMLAVEKSEPSSDESVTVDMPGGDGPMKYLYLLNSVVDGKPRFAAEVRFTDRAGKSASVPLKWGVDVRDWRDLEPKANSFNEHVYRVNPPEDDEVYIGRGEAAAAATTVIEIPAGLGEIGKVAFAVKSQQEEGIFLVHDFFLSAKKLPVNTRPVEIVRKGPRWRPTAFPHERRGIKAGSPMDRSPKERKTVDELGRIVSDGKGNFVFEKDPGKKPIRWLSTGGLTLIDRLDGRYIAGRQKPVLDHNARVRNEADKWPVHPVGLPDWAIPDDKRLQPVARTRDKKAYRAFVHQEIEAAVEREYRAGYRIKDFYEDGTYHSICAENGLDFDEDIMDAFHYTVKCMEDRGMYLTWNIGMNVCYPGRPFCPETWPAETWVSPWGESELSKTNMERCKQATRQLLAQVNPYTGRKLVESPTLVTLLLWNESLFFKDAKCNVGEIRAELKRKYGAGEEGLGNIRAAWGKGWKAEWKSIDEIELEDWMGEKSQRGRDLVEICRSVGEYRIRYWSDFLRSLGFKGLITDTNMVPTFLRMLPRAWPGSYVSGNAYHSHPLGESRPFNIQRIWQDSTFRQHMQLYRGFAVGRIQGEPYVITEGDFPWMNKYRYEQAFGMHALLGMNGMSWMKNFSGGGCANFYFEDELTRCGTGALGNFNGWDDPVKWATEYLGWWMQAGGCVSQSDINFRVDVRMDEVEEEALWNYAITGDQSRLALLGRMSVNFVPKGAKPPPVDRSVKEIAFPRSGRGSKIVLGGYAGLNVDAADAKFAQTMLEDDGTFNLNSTLAELKRRGWIAKDNRTDAARNIYENSTGELYMDFGRYVGTVNSKRMRAIFTDGQLEDIPGFKVTRLEPYGIAAVVAIDGKPVEESKDLMLVFVTDAMNDEMIFDSTSMDSAVFNGFGPPLTRAGRLDCEIANANAGGFSLVALYPDGSDLEDLTKCLKQENGKVSVSLDTSHLAKVSPFYHLRANAAPVAHQTVAFLGGSITEMPGFRPRVMAELRKRYPDVTFEEIAAGLASTCSDTGAFRLSRDVLAKGTPDLFVFDAAVNDDQDGHFDLRHSIRGYEGAVRQVLAANPKCRVVIAQMVNEREYGQIQKGETPIPYEAGKTVAEHYGAAIADVGAALVASAKAGGFSWTEYGDCHPTDAGCDFGAKVVMDAIAKVYDPKKQADAKALPEPLDAGSYFGVRELDLRSVKGDGWTVGEIDWAAVPGSKRDYFTKGEILWSDGTNEIASVTFSGTALGALLTAGPDAGDLEVSVDGGAFAKVALRAYFGGLHYPYTQMLADDLKPGTHTVRFRVIPARRGQKIGTAVRINRLYVNGR